MVLLDVGAEEDEAWVGELCTSLERAGEAVLGVEVVAATGGDVCKGER